MNIEETSNLLTAIQNVDNRRTDDATVLVWHEIVGALPFADCLMAATRHFRESTGYLMPAHIVAGAREIARERAREANTRKALELTPSADLRPLTDRSEEIQAFVRSVKMALPMGKPELIRRPRLAEAQRKAGQARRRFAAAQDALGALDEALAKLTPPKDAPDDHD